MPELPEVETVRRGLASRLEGQVFSRVQAHRPDLRFPLPAGFAERLTGRRLVSLGRRAKYLLFQFDDDTVLLAHLGMSGRFVFADLGEALGRHDHVEFETGSGLRVVYADPRRFGFMDLTTAAALDRHKRLSALGPEPMSNAFNGPVLAARLAGKATAIKAALLDQRVVAGLGNIYVCEALWHAGLSPRRLAHTVQGRRAERLAGAIRAVLGAAIEAGGSSLRDYVQADGTLGYFQHAFNVYDRDDQPCRRDGCNSTIRRITQNGRSTYFCGRCQR